VKKREGLEIHNAAHARGTRNLIIHLVSFASRDVTVSGWRIRQRPRRNRNEEFYGGVFACALSLSLSLSFSYAHCRSVYIAVAFLLYNPLFARARSIDALYRIPLLLWPMCARSLCQPSLVMHYETRNDESAYVSHVMEIPLLIRALNDSATAGYITCIITLIGG